MDPVDPWPRAARLLLAAASINALLAVAAGAFGAHALRARLEPRRLEVFEIAVRYHLVHALALGLCALAVRADLAGAAKAGWVMQAGIVVFSGTLYALALTGVKALGAITPLGGLGLMAGWAMLAVAAWRGGAG